MTDQLRPSDEDALGVDDLGEPPRSGADEGQGREPGPILSGARADPGAVASAMPAADFDQRASEGQNDEKESDNETVIDDGGVQPGQR